MGNRSATKGGRVLVTGAAGMLGSQLLLDAPGACSVVGTDLSAAQDGCPEVEFIGVDLTDERAVSELFEREAFTGVIHAAAFTAVDLAEEKADLALKVNALAPENVAGACARLGIPMVLVSTDFIFDGEKNKPYLEDDPVAPLSVYGATKLEGERRSIAAHPNGLSIARTQWLYGPRGRHFPGTMLTLAESREELSVVNDQTGAPTSTLVLSPVLWKLLERGARVQSGGGVYHAACSGQGSWCDFAKATFLLAGLDPERVKPCATVQFPRPAQRPAHSVLDCSHLVEFLGCPLPNWKDALARFFQLHLNRPVP